MSEIRLAIQICIFATGHKLLGSSSVDRNKVGAKISNSPELVSSNVVGVECAIAEEIGGCM